VYERQQQGTKQAWQFLSVIPEGLETSHFAKLKNTWDEGIEHCFDLKIIIVKNEKVVFKHELYRRTIEASLSPFKRIELNKRIVDLFLDSFEENGEIERIVHYAKNANENGIVVKYAPLAASQAASVGAHVQAAKLFLTAIQYSGGSNADHLIGFYEAYAYESYLTNQIKEAIIYQSKALKVWLSRNDTEKTGNSLRFLSRLWWFDGNREKAEDYARQAIEVLQSQPPSKMKAMAYSNMSQLKMFSEETAECVEWGNKAIEIARTIGDDETLCHALCNVGASLWRVQPSNEMAKQQLMEGLGIALKNSFHEHAGRAYSNIISNYIAFKEFELAGEVLVDGIAYCEERDLDSSKNYKLYQRSRLFLETGYWNDALSIAKNLLQNSAQPTVIKIGALATLATIETRRGLVGASTHLQEVKSYVIGTNEHHQVIPAMIACLEYEWLTSENMITDNEISLCRRLVQTAGSVVINSEFQYWLYKARGEELKLPKLFEPYQLLQSGKINTAASFWKKIGCPFEEGLALSEGNEENKKNALAIFQSLGADAVAEKLKMEMRALGFKNVPRGIRESTKSNPAQITNREIDILQLLQKGLENKKIANSLFISTKTAENHISNIFFKLDVNSRSKAVTEAVRLGILKQG
jgi:DNA-binding CsgD family transcriptional regulator